jgi:hypothetical protein
VTASSQTHDPSALLELAGLVTEFAGRVNTLFGEACVGEVLLAMSIDHLAGEGKTIHDIHSLSTGCYQRCLTVMEGLGKEVPETQRHMGIQGEATAGRRVSGDGDDRFVGVTWCRECRRINGHDDLGVCGRCVGPIDELRVPLRDVCASLERQGLSVVAPISEVPEMQVCQLILTLGQYCYPLAPANFVLGVGIGYLMRHGSSRDDIDDCVAATVESVEALLAEERGLTPEEAERMRLS